MSILVFTNMNFVIRKIVKKLQTLASFLFRKEEKLV